MSKLLTDVPLSVCLSALFGAVLYPLAGLQPSRAHLTAFLGARDSPATPSRATARAARLPGACPARGLSCVRVRGLARGTADPRRCAGLVALGGLASSAIGLVIGCIARSTESALALMPPVVVLMVIFNGAGGARAAQGCARARPGGQWGGRATRAPPVPWRVRRPVVRHACARCAHCAPTRWPCRHPCARPIHDHGRCARAGNSINRESVPLLLRWAPDVSLIRWLFEGMCVNEFVGLRFESDGAEGPPRARRGAAARGMTGERVLGDLSFSDGTVADCATALGALIGCCWLAALCALWANTPRMAHLQEPGTAAGLEPDPRPSGVVRFEFEQSDVKGAKQQ